MFGMKKLRRETEETFALVERDVKFIHDQQQALIRRQRSDFRFLYAWIFSLNLLLIIAFWPTKRKAAK